MTASRRVGAVVGALMLGLLAPVAVAQAADGLTLTPSSGLQATKAGTVTAAGSTSAAGWVSVTAERGGIDCAATLAAQQTRPGAEPLRDQYPAAGTFSYDLAWTPAVAGTYQLCGYLLDGALGDPMTTPLAAATATATVAAEPDTDGDGVPDSADGCPAVRGSTPTGCPAGSTPSGGTPGGGNPVGLPADPTGVRTFKVSKGKAASCGAGCIRRTRTAGPFSVSLTVKVSGATSNGTAVVKLTRKSAQAGKKGKVCLSRFTTKTKQTCRSLTWAVGKPVTVKASMATPAAVRKSGRPGFGVMAWVGSINVGYETAVYFKSSGGRIVPDTDEAACISAVAHAAC